MSFSMTTDQVRRREKTITRRLGWGWLKVGGLFVPVERAMGLKKGEKHVVLWPLCCCVSNRPESLDLLLNPAFADYAAAEMVKEGFPGMDPAEFVDRFCRFNRCPPSQLINRIELDYLPAGTEAPR